MAERIISGQYFASDQKCMSFISAVESEYNIYIVFSPSQCVEYGSESFLSANPIPMRVGNRVRVECMWIDRNYYCLFCTASYLFVLSDLFLKQTNNFLDQDVAAAHAEITTCDFTETQNLQPTSSLEILFTSCHGSQYETTRL